MTRCGAVKLRTPPGGPGGVKKNKQNPPTSTKTTRASKQEAACKKVTARHLQHKRRGTKLCQQCNQVGRECVYLYSNSKHRHLI